MSVDREEGAGSVVYLQGHAVSRRAENKIAFTSTSATSGLVLVIDDEPQVRQVSARYLQQLGYGVEQAQNAYDGLAAFAARSEEFTAVILDLAMPGKDGWQCLAELRAVRSRIPVVICSGFDPENGHLDRSHRHVAFLRKPFRMHDLQSVLHNLLQAPGRGRR